MARGTPTDPLLKAEIIRRIRDEGLKVSDASVEYGISTKTLYLWLRSCVVNGNTSLVLEVNRLRKENEQLYALLGRATAELKRPKR